MYIVCGCADGHHAGGEAAVRIGGLAFGGRRARLGCCARGRARSAAKVLAPVSLRTATMRKRLGRAERGRLPRFVPLWPALPPRAFFFWRQDSGGASWLDAFAPR